MALKGAYFRLVERTTGSAGTADHPAPTAPLSHVLGQASPPMADDGSVSLAASDVGEAVAENRLARRASTYGLEFGSQASDTEGLQPLTARLDPADDEAASVPAHGPVDL